MEHMSRFVSALGPDREPGDPEVKYHHSTTEFSNAWDQSALLQSSLGSGLATVIYRLSYDPAKDKFFSWRQDDQGRETKDSADPTNEALAYEIYSAPSSLLLTSDGQRSLNKRVDQIATHSQTMKPGNAGPPR
jgi:hypothetical protein